MTYGIGQNRLSVISYGKERPVNSGSNPLAWSQNRRSVTVKANWFNNKVLKKTLAYNFEGLFFAIIFLKYQNELCIKL